eukprot:30917-Pelagococcus_subviridis.AAC.3
MKLVSIHHLLLHENFHRELRARRVAQAHEVHRADVAVPEPRQRREILRRQTLYTGERRGGVERRQLKLKGNAGGD